MKLEDCPLPAAAALEANHTAAEWSYAEAFSRNHGLISLAEQEQLKSSRVAIAGMGGVGGIHLLTLARLGIGRFTIADPDVFEVANFNRQAGARTSTIGQSKAEVMAAEARAINPDVEIDVWAEAVTPANVTEFLAGSDVFLDGVDFFALDARRLLFQTARELGMWAVTAGPIGFSTAWLAFDPSGMSFDRYFDLDNCQAELDRLIAFGVGLAPAATHLSYIDLERVDLTARTGPSLSLACQLASGVASAEIVKLLLGRGTVRAAPHYQQFDTFTGQFRHGRLAFGNRHPWQRLKRWYLRRRFTTRGAA
jgi:molybdopterin/thiamine biosynthesis adenylyltransferase